MDETDLIIALAEKFADGNRERTGAEMIANIKAEGGVVTISMTHREWAKCNDRFTRWNLIRSKLRAAGVSAVH